MRISLFMSCALYTNVVLTPYIPVAVAAADRIRVWQFAGGNEHVRVNEFVRVETHHGP